MNGTNILLLIPRRYLTMPCDHKFLSYLNLEKIDFVPSTLIVGTFNPVWPANPAEWFYGRAADSCFWDVLPRLYGEASLLNATSGEWKQFCHSNQIALTDLISSIDDADPGNREHSKILGGFSDKALAYHFDDFVYVNIVQLLRKHPSIKNVYLTRGITEAFWRHTWNPVMQYCSANGIRERKLLTPSDGALYQHGAYNHDHPDAVIPLLEDYILMRWREEWHF
jgi:hypothetical protein